MRFAGLVFAFTVCTAFPAEPAALVQARSDFKAAKERFDSEAPEIATSLNYLASVLEATQRYQEAEANYRRALKIREGISGSDSPQICESLNNLAEFLFACGKDHEAEDLYRRLLPMRERIYGKHSLELALSLSSYAGLLIRNHRENEAWPFYLRVIEIHEMKAGTVFPTVHSLLEKKGDLQSTADGKRTSEPLYKKACQIHLDALGSGHPDLAICFSNIAGFPALKCQPDTKSASALLHQALEIRTATLGLEHPHTACVQLGIAHLHKESGRKREAIAAYRKALAVFEIVPGQKHPLTLSTMEGLAESLRNEDRQAEAAEVYITLVHRSEESLEKDAPEVIARRKALDAVLQTIQLRKNRIAECRRNLAEDEQRHGSTSSKFRSSVHILALELERNGEFEESEALHQKSVALAQKAYGPDDESLPSKLAAYAAFLAHRNRFAEADLLYRRASNICMKSSTPVSSTTAEILHSHAFSVMQSGKLKEAKSLYAAALEMLKIFAGFSQPHREHFEQAVEEYNELNIKLAEQEKDEGIAPVRFKNE